MAAPPVELSEREIDSVLMIAVAKRDREAQYSSPGWSVEVDDVLTPQHRIGKHEQVLFAGAQVHGSPVDLLHFPALVAYSNPVADNEGALE